MNFHIDIRPSAVDELAGVPLAIRRKFRDAIAILATVGPKRRPGLDIRELRGYQNTWRLRVGPYRAFFQVEGASIRFTRFCHRSLAYRP